jgi:hypothetical protein
MAAVIRIVERADGSLSPEAGQYVVWFDHNGEFGRGAGTFDPRKDYALRFDSGAAAMEFWARVASRYQTRDDGLPNKPLTAYTVEIEEVP